MGVATVQLADGRAVKLGRIKPKAVIDVGRFRYVVRQDGSQTVVPLVGHHFGAKGSDGDGNAASRPESVDYYTAAKASILRKYKNDVEGICVVASVWHIIGAATAAKTGTALVGPDSEAEFVYREACGPGDNGCDIASVNDYWQKKGVKINGVAHYIDGWVAVDHTNQELVKAVIQEWGHVKLGIDLPSAWTSTNSVWDVTNTGTVGGHDVPGFGYGKAPPEVNTTKLGVSCATWGGMVQITWEAFLSRRYVTECYVALPKDWYGSDGIGASGINAATLKSDLALVAGGTIPPLPPEFITDYFA